MSEYIVVKGQSLVDICVQLFGNDDQLTIEHFVKNNTDLLKNDTNLVGSVLNSDYFYINLPIEEGLKIIYDEKSELIKKQIVQNLDGNNIISYDI